jgi:hypothetical protein
MATQLTADDARQSLESHAESKGAEMREKYGDLGWGQLLQILRDDTLVRYPCEVIFDANGLIAGECAHAAQKGELPSDGFTIFVHPRFAANPPHALRLVLYQLVVVNYGPFAASSDAEALGAAALGISREQYYSDLCQSADQLA